MDALGQPVSSSYDPVVVYHGTHSLRHFDKQAECLHGLGSRGRCVFWCQGLRVGDLRRAAMSSAWRPTASSACAPCAHVKEAANRPSWTTAGGEKEGNITVARCLSPIEMRSFSSFAHVTPAVKIRARTCRFGRENDR
jgi:hypothetical protein